MSHSQFTELPKSDFREISSNLGNFTQAKREFPDLELKDSRHYASYSKMAGTKIKLARVE